MITDTLKCPDCNGSGKYQSLFFIDTCKKCSGTGIFINFDLIKNIDSMEFNYISHFKKSIDGKSTELETWYEQSQPGNQIEWLSSKDDQNILNCLMIFKNPTTQSLELYVLIRNYTHFTVRYRFFKHIEPNYKKEELIKEFQQYGMWK